MASSQWSASAALPPRAAEGDENKPVEVDEVMVEVGGENTIPEFSENLRDAKPGDHKKFDVKYADDFSDKRLAGKTLTYEVDIKSIKTRSVPEPTDEFAQGALQRLPHL